MSYRDDTQSRNYIPANIFKQDLTNALNEQRAQRAEQKAQYNKEAAASFDVPTHERYAAHTYGRLKPIPLYENAQQNIMLRMQEDGWDSGRAPVEERWGPLAGKSRAFGRDVQSAVDRYNRFHPKDYIPSSRSEARDNGLYVREGQKYLEDIYKTPLYAYNPEKEGFQ
jgi:hypothetical protein